MSHDHHKRRHDDEEDAGQWHPLDFVTRRWIGSDDVEPLTAEVARGWLETGAPPCQEIVRRHGMQKWFMPFIDLWRAREVFVREIGFAVPCEEAVAACVAASPLLEVGAGTGFWSALIARAGGDIIAVDDVGEKKYSFTKGVYRPVLSMEAVRAVQSYPDRNVLLVWPCYDDNWAAQVVKAMQPGRTLLLVSEGQGGCVGDDDLFETLGEWFDDLDTVYVPVWPFIGDYLTIHRKRTTPLPRPKDNPEE